MSRTRKPQYRKSRIVDVTCRCNGSCAYCRSNRLHAVRRQQQAAEYDRELWQRGESERAIESYEFDRDADNYEAQTAEAWRKLERVTADDYVAMMRRWAEDDC